MRLGWRWAIGGLVVASGCTLLVDTEELAGGLPPRPALPSAPAAVRDAAVDGAQGLDAALDGGDAGDPRAFCDRASHTFCADFSDPANVLAGWTARDIPFDGGTLELAPGLGASFPPSLDARCNFVEGVAGELYSCVGLRRRADGDNRFFGTKWELSFAVRPEAMPAQHRTYLVSLLFANGIFYIILGNEGVGASGGFYSQAVCGSDSQCMGFSVFGSRALRMGDWSNVRLSIYPRDGGGGSDLRLTSNGQTDVEIPLPSLFNATTPGQPVELKIGLPIVTGAGAARRVLVDDVALDVSTP